MNEIINGNYLSGKIPIPKDEIIIENYLSGKIPIPKGWNYYRKLFIRKNTNPEGMKLL